MSEIDWRESLKAYMRHVISHDGAALVEEWICEDLPDDHADAWREIREEIRSENAKREREMPRGPSVNAEIIGRTYKSVYGSLAESVPAQSWPSPLLEAMKRV